MKKQESSGSPDIFPPFIDSSYNYCDSSISINTAPWGDTLIHCTYPAQCSYWDRHGNKIRSVISPDSQWIYLFSDSVISASDGEI